MLEYLRNAAEKPVAKILISILAFSFIGWGVAEWIFSGTMGDNTLMRVGGHKVSMQQFNMEKSRQLAAMTREQQRATYADPALTAALNASVLGTIASQQMAQNRADDLGFVVTDGRIAREIREFPEFQLNGRFSTYLFSDVLRNSGYSEADFADVLRGQVLRQMVLGSMVMPIAVPKFAVLAAYNARYATRDIEYATVNFSDYKVGTPTDDQLREYYAQNPQVVPEQRTASYVLVPAKMDTPDTYDAGYTLAQRVEDDIISGDALSVAAKKHDAKFVALKPVARGEKISDSVLTDAMIAKIFAMDEGTESEILETKQGFVIIRLDAVAPEHNAEYASVKNNLIADWQRAEQKKQAYVRANEILVDLNQNNKFNGKSATVTRANGAPIDVLAAAFNSPINTNLIVPTNNAFYVLRVKSEKMPTTDKKRLDALRSELIKASSAYTLDDYNSFLKRTYPVKVNEKVYNRFFK